MLPRLRSLLMWIKMVRIETAHFHPAAPPKRFSAPVHVEQVFVGFYQAKAALETSRDEKSGCDHKRARRINKADLARIRDGSMSLAGTSLDRRKSLRKPLPTQE